MNERFQRLVAEAQACRVCPSMEDRRRILSTANGPPDARVMLVGEAPGRIGAERSGIPFHGDESGRRLDRLMEAAGWSRDEIFITNAVLCNPQTPTGRNRPPAVGEVRACNHWLASQIEVVNPRLVVALGAVALNALAGIYPHGTTVSDAGQGPIAWRGRWLAAVYHPGARAAIHRSVGIQLNDFKKLGEWSRLMSEVTPSTEEHRDTVLVRGGDTLVIPD